MTFYSNFLLFNTLITLVCLFLFWEYGLPIFHLLFGLKILTLALVWYFITAYKKQEFYYYHNLGLSKTQLWATTLGFDLAIFLVLFIPVNTYR